MQADIFRQGWLRILSLNGHEIIGKLNTTGLQFSSVATGNKSNFLDHQETHS